MPPLSFGLKPNKPITGLTKPPVKRKAPFDLQQEQEQDDEEDENEGAFGKMQAKPAKTKPAMNAAVSSTDRPSKSPRLEHGNGDIKHAKGHEPSKYANLSSLRSAKLQDEEAAKLDSSVYDYDEVYDTFSAEAQKKTSSKDTDHSNPKYMNSLLASAEVRKRDQLRAREKLLQKEREAEGDEFADKEKFVTSAYKKQQEEITRLEEEEKKRAEEEEERRRKGGGMTAFHKDLLKKDEERQKAMEAATEAAKSRNKQEGNVREDEDVEMTDSKVAAKLNEKDANIVINDEGDIIDKRQLLTAGLNVAPKKNGVQGQVVKTGTEQIQTWQRSSEAQDARLSQRERQTRMIEQQIEEMTRQQHQAEEKEEKEREEKNQSKITDNDKLGARERFLQRKKEREEEAAKKAKGSGG